MSELPSRLGTRKLRPRKDTGKKSRSLTPDVGPEGVGCHDMRYILCQDIRYTLPPRICGKGGPRPALPAAAPMLACVAAGDRSPAHTCAGSLPAVVPPLPPRERVVRPVLHT